MPLIENGEIVADNWRMIGEEERLPADSAVIVPIARLRQNGEDVDFHTEPLGALIPNDIDVDLLRPWFGRLEIIAVDFPAFADGRGFSIGVLLRRLGYKGILRAKGRLIPDQYSYARRCGFDQVEIPGDLLGRHGPEAWTDKETGGATGALSLSYQADDVTSTGGASALNILAARRRVADRLSARDAAE